MYIYRIDFKYKKEKSVYVCRAENPYQAVGKLFFEFKNTCFKERNILDLWQEFMEEATNDPSEGILMAQTKDLEIECNRTMPVDPDSPTYLIDDAVIYTMQNLPSIYKNTLKAEDISFILLKAQESVEKTRFDMDSESYDSEREGFIYNTEAVTAFVLESAQNEGRVYSAAEVEAVIEAESTYLKAAGMLYTEEEEPINNPAAIDLSKVWNN